MQWIKNNLPAVMAVCVIVIIFAMMPWYPFALHLRGSVRLPFYGNFGSWLQGILTPAAIVFAALSFFSQSAAQREANKIASRAFFIANIDKLHGHLFYRVLCAIVDDTPPDITKNNAEVANQVIQGMNAIFKGFPADLTNSLPPQYQVHILEEIVENKHYAILARDIEDIISLAKEAELSTLIDNRINRIREGIVSNPPRPNVRAS